MGRRSHFLLALATALPPAYPATAAAAQMPQGAFAALQRVPEVRALAWSGPLPGNVAAFNAFVGKHQQLTLASTASRLRRTWQERLGFDLLDAQALARAGIVAARGVTFVAHQGTATPLLLLTVSDEAALRRVELAALAEEEGPGELRCKKTARGRPWRQACRRFGPTLREAGAMALLPKPPGADAVQEVLLAPAGTEAALAALLDAYPANNAGVGRDAAVLEDAVTLWQRRPLHPNLGANAVAQLQFHADEVLVSVVVPRGEKPSTPKAALVVPAPPNLAPNASAADTSAGGLSADVGPTLLAEAWGQQRGPTLAQLDVKALPDLVRRLGARLPQPALAQALESGLAPLQALSVPAWQPLMKLAAAHDGPLWLRAYVRPASSNAPAPLGVGVVARLDGDDAALHLQRFLRGACAPSTGAKRLGCVAKLSSPAGRATVLADSSGRASYSGRDGSALEVAAVGRWLLAASERTTLVRMLAALPPAAPPSGQAVASAGAPATVSAGWPPALLADTTPLQASGSLAFAAAADLVVAAMRPHGESALALGALGLLPQLLLAGPLGDALHELAGLGLLHVRMRQDGRALHVAARLEAPP